MHNYQARHYIQDTPSCATCERFHPHYVYYCGRYHTTHFGHCSYPRLKDRYITDSCVHFKERE